MNKEEKILWEVEKTLNSIDSLPKLESNPFLYTRLKARIISESIKHGSKETTDFVLRPVTMAFLLAINIITAVYIIGFSNSSTISSTSVSDTMKQEYGVIQIQSDNYNLE